MAVPDLPPPPSEPTYLADGVLAMEAFGRALGRQLGPWAREGFTLALEGELGAGKTTLVRALARGLGLAPRAPLASPTFTLAQRFDLPGGVQLQHVDAYRLSGAHELEAAGLEEMCGSGRITCVEWAGRVAEALPRDHLEVHLLACPSPTVPHAPGEPPPARSIHLRGSGPRSRAFLTSFVPPARMVSS